MATELERQIHSQPAQLESLLAADVEPAANRIRTWRRTWLVGTGTSQHAAELGAAMLTQAGLEAHARPAMTFLQEWPARDLDGIVVITHTGTTAFALAARNKALEVGLPVVSITGRGLGWPDALETVPTETSETYTVSYTASLLLLARVAGLAAEGVPDAVRTAIEGASNDTVPEPERALVLAGAGPAGVTAREGALKLREASRLLAEGFDADYLLHGSAVPLGARDGLVLLEPPVDRDGLLHAVGAAAARESVAVTTIADESGLSPLLAQIPLTVRLQLLALRFAQERGENPDKVMVGAWDESAIWALGRPQV